MRRNRESAAQSRNRKKQNTENLEEEKEQLTALVAELQQENHRLRTEHACLTGGAKPPPAVPPEGITNCAGLSPRSD